jgi:8-oxo-dGTP diphosphatase
MERPTIPQGETLQNQGQQQQQGETKMLASIAVLIHKGDSILLNKRANVHGAGTWAPIVGHPEFGESFEDCAIRETKEETGVMISDVKFRVVTNDVFEKEHKHYATIWMEAKYVSGAPHVGDPHEESEVGWFTWDALPEPLFLPLQHLLEGKTYPSQTVSKDQVGEALQPPSILHEPHAQ